MKIYETDKEEISKQINQLGEAKRLLLEEEMELEASILQKKLKMMQKKDLSQNILSIITKIKESASTIKSSIDKLEVRYGKKNNITGYV